LYEDTAQLSAILYNDNPSATLYEEETIEFKAKLYEDNPTAILYEDPDKLLALFYE